MIYYLQPNQVWMAERLGWIEGVHYRVVKPLPSSGDPDANKPTTT